jgi:hypothetical protein
MDLLRLLTLQIVEGRISVEEARIIVLARLAPVFDINKRSRSNGQRRRWAREREEAVNPMMQRILGGEGLE